MNYIIFDLELNSKPFKNRHPNEIIEIGAVKLDNELNIISSFQSFVKPKIYKKLFSIVKQKTSITQDNIKNANSFKEVLDDFKAWIDGDFILCSWGHDDIHHLKSNCEFNRRKSNWLKNSFDIQKHFSKLYGLPVGQRASLENALNLLGIPLKDELHRADIDAKYTAEIFIKIFDKLDFNK